MEKNSKLLPTKPHPAVKAFTNALAVTLNDMNDNHKNGTTGSCEDKVSTSNSKRQTKERNKRNSALVRKVSQTLGWRNRYSQSTFYPLEIQYNAIIDNQNKNDDVTSSMMKNHSNDNTAIPNADAADMEVTTTTRTLQIKQVQRGEIENTFGTGATVWPASLVLVKYLEHLVLSHARQELQSQSSLRELFCGPNHDVNSYTDIDRRITIADLGSGTGVTSIAIAFLLGFLHSNGNNECNESQGPFIVCTDGVDSVVDLASENVENTIKDLVTVKENSVETEKLIHDSVGKTTNMSKSISRDKIYEIGQSQIKVRKYLWGDGTMLEELKFMKDDNGISIDHHRFDIILVSDCVLPRLYPIQPLVDAIDELTGPRTVTYLSYEYRYYPEYDPKEFFVTAAREKGLCVKSVPIEEQHSIYSVDDIEIWEVRRLNTES